MKSVISDTILIKSPTMPPSADFIEEQIKNKGIEPLRWAIVDIKDNNLTVSYSGTKD